MVKNLSEMWETWFDPWVGKIPWRRKKLPNPIFLSGEFLGQYYIQKGFEAFYKCPKHKHSKIKKSSSEKGVNRRNYILKF